MQSAKIIKTTDINFNWKIGGPAGLGIMTTGLIFSKTCSRSGLFVFDYPEYPSLIRGGQNTYQVYASSQEVFSQIKPLDLLVALDENTLKLNNGEVKNGGGIIYDPEINKCQSVPPVGESKYQKYPVPFLKIIREINVSKVMLNNIALGASCAFLGLDIAVLITVIKDIFKEKGEIIVAENQKAAKAGYEYIKKNFQFSPAATEQAIFNFQLDSLSKGKSPNKIILTGNEAAALGAIAAGCQFYAAYPMTPATSILHYLSAKELETNMIIKHAEDEISVINMAIGAAYAGVRSMVATSGGGFALMTEAVSLAGMTETPLVIIVSQRPGPASGMPTWTEQGDLKFIVNSGHGEFPKIVLAPGDAEECFSLTQKAFALADEFHCPVFIVLDKYLSESHQTVHSSPPKVSHLGHVKSSVASDDSAFRLASEQAQFTVHSFHKSKRKLPDGKTSVFLTNSYEHDDKQGFANEKSLMRIKMVNGRLKKIEEIKKVMKLPKLYGPQKAKTTLIAWGSQKGPCLEALKIINRAGNYANLLHFTHLWPINNSQMAKLLHNYQNLAIIENNATAQFASLIRETTGIEIKNKILKYDGRPFYPEEITKYIATTNVLLPAEKRTLSRTPLKAG